MSQGIDQVASHVVLDHLGHEPGHGTTHARDQMQDLLAAGFAFERSFDRVDLASHPADARQQLVLLTDGMGHARCYTIGGCTYIDKNSRHAVLVPKGHIYRLDKSRTEAFGRGFLRLSRTPSPANDRNRRVLAGRGTTASTRHCGKAEKGVPLASADSYPLPLAGRAAPRLA